MIYQEDLVSGFKVLFVYPNTPLLNPPPVSIGIFTALLKKKGIDVQVFDTTFYAAQATSDKAKEDNLQVRPFSFDETSLPTQTSDPTKDVVAFVEDYRPDLVAMSVLEATWDEGATLIAAIKASVDVPVVVGGVYPTFSPDRVLAHSAVDMVCIGEGEGALVDLCILLREGGRVSDIDNLWIKTEDGIVQNPVREVVDIDTLPIPDYSAFHRSRFLRPMAGRVYRTVPIETNRGCPFQCAFCNSPATAKMYNDADAGVFFRKKSMTVIAAELDALIKAYDAEYCYFLSDTFLAMTDDEFDRFIDIYSTYRLPFWMQSRPETVTAYRAERLKEVGCHRMSIGLEHGNPHFRKRLLNKKFGNDTIISAARILEDVGIPLTVNNIIGFPEETRELVFDTIELNRKVPSDSVNAYAFTPFHGTPLHQQCVRQGLISEERTVGCLTLDTPLDMPQLSSIEIMGLRKTFALYVKLPKSYWPDIRLAENDDEEGHAAFEVLSKLYQEKYF